MLNNVKIKELKNFLRKLKVTGKKEILVARAFCAIENNVTLVKTAQEVEAQIKGYSKKLARSIQTRNWLDGRGRWNCVLANYTCHVHSQLFGDQ